MRSLFLCFGLCLIPTSSALAQIQGPETSLWCSDDVGRRIYRVSMDGTFVYSSFYSGSISGLAVDPSDGTIWAAKEGSARIMHFDRLGNRLGTIESAVYDPTATGPEGIGVDFFDNTLWIIDDDSARLYNVTKTGSPADFVPLDGRRPEGHQPPGHRHRPHRRHPLVHREPDRRHLQRHRHG